MRLLELSLFLLWRCCAGVQFQAQPFSEFSNTSTVIGQWSGVLAEGALLWPTGQQAKFAVLPALVTNEEASNILSLLPTEFDEDPDSVDKMMTYEFYLEKNGAFDTIASIPGKVDADPDILKARRPTREKLAQITRPIMRDRIVPFVNERYPDACKGKCTICHSLVRRYLEEERRSHAMHFDIQALVTVVVSLNGHGSGFTGGLYVGTSNQVQFIELQTGDAIVHQSDLLHGVQVKGQRWSWIMWLKDSQECQSDPSTWNRDIAVEGNPVGQFLQAHRVHLGKIGTPGPGARAREKFEWLLKAAEGGFPRAQNEVGMAYKEGDGVRVNLKRAEEWLDKAAKNGEADALYNKGLLYLDKGKFDKAVELFLAAAEGGSWAPNFNLGLAYARGAGGLIKDVEKALKWWEADGSAAAFHAMYQLLIQENRTTEAGGWLKRAGQLGNVPAMVLLGIASEDPKVQERWWRRAARGGNTDAMLELGKLLRRQGNTEGRGWLRRASEMGNQQATDLLEPQGIPLNVHQDL